MTARPAAVLAWVRRDYVTLALARAGYGALLLTRPDLVARPLLGGALDPRARRVARVLGARHLAQALVCGYRPGSATLVLGVELDLAHAASMAGLGVAVPARRRAAWTSAAGAAAFALAGLATARSRRRQHPATATPGTATPGSLPGRRDRLADRLARLLAPGYPSAHSNLDQAGTPGRKEQS